MIKHLRTNFNRNFTNEAYKGMLQEIQNTYRLRPTFPVGETPVFIPDSLRDQLIEASNEILKFIDQPNFKNLTEGSFFSPDLRVPNEDAKSSFVVMDFGICEDPIGGIIPQLIELQGFSTLNFYQYMMSEMYKAHFDIPQELTTHFGGISRSAYKNQLRNLIIADHDPREVVLIDVEPDKQNTRIDFLVTEKELGIETICVSDVKMEGKNLFYLDSEGIKTPIRRIYNRAIFDELHQRTDLEVAPFFKEEINAEWVCHPNWFYRISKYILPLLKSTYVPDCHFLDHLDTYPEDLENYVLKPLYSFAGAGVRLNVTKSDLDMISDRKNYLLQRKVTYKPVVETLDEPAKCEIRIMAFYDSMKSQYVLHNNLIRLSKGEMIGVKHNKYKTWVGGTIGFLSPSSISCSCAF